MLTIRLTRKGRKNQPFFRVIVTDKRNSAKGGRPTEIVGHIDPLTKRKSLQKDRILYWLKVGAKPSPTVHNLLISEKVIEGKKISKFKKSKKAIEAEKAAATAKTAEAKTEAPKAIGTAKGDAKAAEPVAGAEQPVESAS